jgi:hypothetical protein
MRVCVSSKEWGNCETNLTLCYVRMLQKNL